MKKQILIIMILGMLCPLSACNTHKEKVMSSSSSESSQVNKKKDKDSTSKSSTSSYKKKSQRKKSIKTTPSIYKKEKMGQVSTVSTTTLPTKQKNFYSTIKSSTHAKQQVTNQPSDMQQQRCPSYSEMTPEAKSEMERYYDGNNDGIPDSQQDSKIVNEKQKTYIGVDGNEYAYDEEDSEVPTETQKFQEENTAK